MINAKNPYYLEYTNNQNNALRALLNNQVVATASRTNFIKDAYYHPNAGIVFDAVGVDDYIATIEGNNIVVRNWRKIPATVIKTIAFTGNLEDVNLNLTSNGQIMLDIFQTSLNQIQIDLKDVVLTLLLEMGYKISAKLLPVSFIVWGIAIPTTANKMKVINDLCELLACELIINENVAILSPYNLTTKPIYIEEQEHSFSVAYSFTSSTDSTQDYSFNNLGLRYIKDAKPKVLLDYKSELSFASDNYIYDTSIICTDDQAKQLLINARTSKIYKQASRRKAIVETTNDYIRVEIGDYCALNGRFWLCTDIFYKKGKIELHMEERAINADYPNPPTYAKPPINPTAPPAPPPLSIILINMISGLSDFDCAPLMLYIEPQIDLAYTLDNKPISLNIVYKESLLIDLPGQSTHIALNQKILDSSLSGYALLDNELIYFRRGEVISRCYFDTITDNHTANIDVYTTSRPNDIKGGTHSFIATTSNGLYTMINSQLNSQPSPIRQENYTMLDNQTHACVIVPYQIDF